MPRLTLVRHGAAAASWDTDIDPGLGDEGRAQAAALAAALRGGPGRPHLVTSPLRRARETAAALEDLWATEARVEAAVGEIPSAATAPQGRGKWLGEVLSGRWPELDPGLRAWRRRLLETLLALEADTVVVTHFVAINAAVGRAVGDDRVVCFHPANCSRTVLHSDGSGLVLVQRGDQADSRVL